MIDLIANRRNMHETKPKSYVCWVCGASFTDPSHFLFHINRHRR
ncbi:MAG: hypothetical protein ACP5K9_03340 [Candidatus Micrarchaeia archaeon]